MREQRIQDGESEAIVLAEEIQAATLLMDEQQAVACARRLGIRVVRTPLIYAEAKLRGLIPSVRVKLDALREHGFWLKEQAYLAVLREAGEEPYP